MLPLASVHHHDHDEWIDILFCVNCQMLYWPLYDIYFPVLYGNKLFEIKIEIELNFWQKIVSVLFKAQCVQKTTISTGSSELTHWPLEWCGNDFKSVVSEHMLWIKFLSTPCETALRWMPQDIFDDTGYGWVLSGNKPLFEPMMTLILVAI